MSYKDHEGPIPRGIRNNNPGNILTNPDYAWRGQVGADDMGFCKFSKPTYGLRAIGILAKIYVTEHHIHDLNEFFQRWSPEPPGRWQSYASFVGKQARVKPSAPIELDKHQLPYLKALVTFENGYCPYNTTLLLRAISMSHVR